jgi:hypothetical protein
MNPGALRAPDRRLGLRPRRRSIRLRDLVGARFARSQSLPSRRGSSQPSGRAWRR